MQRPRTIESAGEPAIDGFTLLVAVANPDHVQQLMRTAGDLARGADGSIHVVSVVAKDQNSPFGVFDDETIRTEFAPDSRATLEAAVTVGESLDVPVTGAVVVDRAVSRGVVRAAKSVDADAILVGWTGPAWRPRAVLGTTVDALLERAPIDVYVERIGATADGVERVLVPVAGGPHQELAARAGHAIARGNGAILTLLSVTDGSSQDTENAGVTERTEFLASARRSLDEENGDRIETRIVESDDVVAAIVETTGDHDLVVMGVTRGGALRARLVGSTPRAVTDRTDHTVILARRWTGPRGLTDLFGRLRRR